MWDGFIIDGWKWWFKVILWLMRMLEPEIMKMNFEQIMKCFSDLQSTLFSASRKQMVDYGIDERKVRQEINKVKL